MGKRYYLTQYGSWWSLNEKEFLGLLKQVEENNCYDLIEFKELKNRPSCTYMFDGDPYTRKRNVKIVECLDWDKSDFKLNFPDEYKQLSLT